MCWFVEDALRLQSPSAFRDTLARVRDALKARGFTIMATVDHRAAAQMVGLDMPPTTVLVYGNPAIGTALMLATPDIALELPLRVLIREGLDGKTYVVFNTAETLKGRHGLPADMARRLAPAETVVRNAVASVGSDASISGPMQI
jgi:uncharacterized protein (DUF302 family)